MDQQIRRDVDPRPETRKFTFQYTYDRPNVREQVQLILRRTPYENFGPSHYLVVLTFGDGGGGRWSKMAATLPCSPKAVSEFEQCGDGDLCRRGFDQKLMHLGETVVAAARGPHRISGVSHDGVNFTLVLGGSIVDCDPFGYLGQPEEASASNSRHPTLTVSEQKAAEQLQRLATAARHARAAVLTARQALQRCRARPGCCAGYGTSGGCARAPG